MVLIKYLKKSKSHMLNTSIGDQNNLTILIDMCKLYYF